MPPVQQDEIEAFDGNILPGRFQESYLARLEGFYCPAKVYWEYITESGLFYDALSVNR